MIRFVLDSSFAMSWAFKDEHTSESLRILHALANGHAEACVPSLWFFEISNVLLVAEKRKRLTVEESESFIEALVLLPIREAGRPARQLLTTLPALARSVSLTAYDSAYLDLALYEGGIPLVTLDADLKKAAERGGLPAATDLITILDTASEN